MIPVLALVLAAVDAPGSSVSPAGKNEIVVRGRSLASLQADLDRCITDHCPLRQDVIASVRVGEALFRQGRYLQSRQLLQRAVDRDRDRAQTDPLAMAALYEATATVATHEGDQSVARHAAGARMRLLGSTVGPDSYDSLRADLDYLDFSYSHAPNTSIDESYRRLGERAEAAGQPGIAALVALRRANIAAAYDERGKIDRLLAPLIAGSTSLPPAFRLAALSLKAKWARGGAKASAVAAFQNAVADTPQPAPVLLSSPPNPFATDQSDINYFNLVDRESRSSTFHLRWIDIGFAIQPDGTVEDTNSLRGTMAEGDVREIEKVIQARRYAAFPATQGDRYRVERWTLTADYGQLNGSLIRARGFNPHFVSLDITTDPTAAPTPGSNSG